MTLSTLLIIILILILIGVVPTWGHSRGWIWAVWHCRPHPCRDHCSSSNGQALTGLVFSALCAAAAERSNVHGTFAFQFPLAHFASGQGWCAGASRKSKTRSLVGPTGFPSGP